MMRLQRPPGRKTDIDGTNEGRENAELRRRAEKQGARIRDQRAEIGQRADAKENQRRKDLERNALGDVVVEAAPHVPGRRIDHALRRQVRQERPERDGDQKQRFEFPEHPQIQQATRHDPHDAHAPRHLEDARQFQQMRQGFHALPKTKEPTASGLPRPTYRFQRQSIAPFRRLARRQWCSSSSLPTRSTLGLR